MSRVVERVRGGRSAEATSTCPAHLTAAAAKEWRRVARALRGMGVLTAIDRAALAAYCQAYGRWVEAEERLRETPMLFKTPSGYVQQSPWLGIINKQLELMGRYMVELGMTPASRSRVTADVREPITYVFRTTFESKEDAMRKRTLSAEVPAPATDPDTAWSKP
jgi:P27 family predicted phage terminase small subunit